ncbi:MAG TPA: hypothetical protein VFY82_06440, partial [Acidimicrobiales bacterium]|nr:hypothetical protein [Acidimicrobiales bacterium]
RLRTFASQIADARRHSLRKPETNGDEHPEDEAALDEMRHEDDKGDQLSMFAALSAVVTGEDESSVFDIDEAVLDELDHLDDLEDGGGGDTALELALPSLPGGPDGVHVAGAGGNGSNPRRERAQLREANAKLVQDLVWATGMGHAQVNGQLNRLVGLRRIDEATVDQLRRRAQQAERWLAKI